MSRIDQYVLGIGYNDEDFEDAAQVWLEYGIILHRVYSAQEAVEQLRQRKYVCVTICSDELDYSPLIRPLRETGPIPIIVISPQYDAKKRAELLQQGAAQYILHTGDVQKAAASGKDGIRYYLGLEETEGPLTIIQQGDLTLYVEYRTVEVCGKELELTRKEFDILHLLLTNRKRVMSYEKILELVWGMDYLENPKKLVSNHISNLRGKLGIDPDIPGYIRAVPGVGYKFDPV